MRADPKAISAKSKLSAIRRAVFGDISDYLQPGLDCTHDQILDHTMLDH
jgi:hypothetical protein